MGTRKAIFALRPIETAKSIMTGVLDTILPPHSLITGKPRTEEESRLWQALRFIDAPQCEACGFPFEFDPGKGILCARCHANLPRYDRARSAITYSDQSRKLVLDFKYGGRMDGLSFFAAQMQRVGRKLLEDADFLVPVPLHRSRLRQRRFNQATLLARKLSQQNRLPIRTDILIRHKNTPSQGGQSFTGRRRNVAAAFSVHMSRAADIPGTNILLIDDVHTTGATLDSCAKPLKRAGATRVDALTLMRVIRPLTVPK